MKVKCFACALVAGMALSAVAMADPGVQQAGGTSVAAPIAVRNGEFVRLPKGQTPGHAIYHLATRQVEILSRPGEVDSSPALRGTNLIWSAETQVGFYWNQIGAAGIGGPLTEAFDWGVLCGDPLTVTHTVNKFTFAYATTDIPVDPNDTGLQLDINLYWGFDPMCAADPDGTVAGGGCLAANGAFFTIGDAVGTGGGLPGSAAGAVDAWIVDIDLTGFEQSIPAGEFAYSYTNYVGFTNCGPLLVAEDQIAAPGTDNAWDQYTTSPQTALLGTYWFGGTPYSQFYFAAYSSDTTCGAGDLGSCCLADLSCVVVTEADCTTQGGTGFQLGVACAGAFFCYPAPANDDCLNAETITGFGQFGYDNRGASAGGEGAASCVTPTEDVWFKWTAPCTGDVTVSTCLLNATDDAFAVYQGSNCGDLSVEVACDDDGCGVVGGQSTKTFAVTQGTSYLMRMGTWGGTDGGQNFMDLVNVSCTGGPMFCDADWCHDGAVGVPDIFCFLSDWFAFVPAARSYGGTPGVPAIFAFLSIWFATGQGPCTP